MKRLVSLLVLTLFFFPSAVEAKKPKKKCGAKSWASCPKKGCGGDPRLNERKNIKTKPAASEVEETTLDDMEDLEQPPSWKAGTIRTDLKDMGEGTPVVVTAFLLEVKGYKSGAESCNCNLTGYRNNDFHLVRAEDKDDEEEESITAEISPRIRPNSWTLKALKVMAKNKDYVRLTGYLMLDTQHLKKTLKRRTNWEIHPVTKFEVCTETVVVCNQGDGWKTL